MFILGALAFAALLGCQYLVCQFAYTRFVEKENERAAQLFRAFDPRSRQEQSEIAEGKRGVSDASAGTDEHSRLWGKAPFEMRSRQHGKPS